MTADLLTLFYWLYIPLGILLVCALQRDGRHYWPAYLIVGVAVAVPTAFYLGALVIVGTVDAVRDFAAAYRTTLVTYPIQALLVTWALALVVRVNLLPLGSRVDLLGRKRAPNARQIECAIVTIQRAERHGLMTTLARKWLREDVDLRRVMALLDARQVESVWALLWRFLRRRCPAKRRGT